MPARTRRRCWRIECAMAITERAAQAAFSVYGVLHAALPPFVEDNDGWGEAQLPWLLAPASVIQSRRSLLITAPTVRGEPVKRPEQGTPPQPSPSLREREGDKPRANAPLPNPPLRCAKGRETRPKPAPPSPTLPFVARKGGRQAGGVARVSAQQQRAAYAALCCCLSLVPRSWKRVPGFKAPWQSPHRPNVHRHCRSAGSCSRPGRHGRSARGR